MKKLLTEIKGCTICSKQLPHEPRPVLSVSPQSKVLIIGQAPGKKVHESGIPWNDQSGNELRRWLGVDKDQFYNTAVFGIMPMGFCFPGTGKSGDLPPRPECAAAWHQRVLKAMKNIQLTLLIGQYAQDHYLGNRSKTTLTENVKSYRSFLPEFIPLVHPSPRNKIWQKKNPWFENEVVPFLQETIKKQIR